MGRPWKPRIFVAVLFGWSLFVLFNLFVSGHWWWLVFSLIPPVVYLGVSLAALLVASFFRAVRSRVAVLLAGLSVVFSAPQSGLVPQVWWYQPPQAGTAVRVVAWNTEYWHQGTEQHRFFSRLRAMDADVYLLSEHLNYRNRQVVPIDDRAALAEAFPGYHIVRKGQLVTLSRLPVVGRLAVADPGVLRVDLQLPRGTRISTYNVHVPAQLDPTASPFSREFYATLRQRARERGRCYRALRASASENPHPGVIAGDLNTTASMAELRQVRALGEDVAPAGGDPYPLSWNVHHRTELWRLDWMFVRNGISAERYRLIGLPGMSDHRAQLMDGRVATAS